VLSGALQELKDGAEHATRSPAEVDRVGLEAVLRGVKQQFKHLRRGIERAPRRAWEEWIMLAEVRRAEVRVVEVELEVISRRLILDDMSYDWRTQEECVGSV